MRSVVAKASYNSGENLYLAREDRRMTLQARHDIFLTELLVPEGAPEWATEREKLWNTVDRTAKRKDARLAKEITAAITIGIPPEQWSEMVLEYAQAYVELGQVVDIAIHEDGSLSNPHVHFLMTVNHLGTDGFKLKITQVDQKRFVTQARRRWEALTNKYLKANGLSLRVDARSFKARGISQQPSRHRGANRAERHAWRQRAQLHASQEHLMKPPKHDDYSDREQENQPDTMPEPDTRAWYEQAVDNVPVAQPSVDQSSLYGEQWDRSLDTVEQARAEPATDQENALRAAVKDAPEPLRYEVEAEILHQKEQRISAREQAERLDYLEQNLDADGLREFQAYMEDERQHQNNYPQPERGPHDELLSPVELADARRRMIEENERDDKRQR